MSSNLPLPRAILFFGPDGSGKTTQANLLLNTLSKKHIKTKKIWLRSLHTLAFIISKIAMIFLRLENVYQFRSKYACSPRFRNLWYFIEFISILPLILYRFYIPFSLGHVIVAERFVIDWIVSLAYESKNKAMIETIFSKIALRFIPKQSLLIYIDADYDTILLRGRNEESVEIINFQRRLYYEFALRLNAIVINTNGKTIDSGRCILCRRSHLQTNP